MWESMVLRSSAEVQKHKKSSGGRDEDKRNSETLEHTIKTKTNINDNKLCQKERLFTCAWRT